MLYSKELGKWDEYLQQTLMA